MDYEAGLSTPASKSIKDKQLVYYCAPCLTLWVFRQFDTKLAIGGRLVMSMAKLKRAGFYGPDEPDYIRQPYHPKITPGSLPGPKLPPTKGVA